MNESEIKITADAIHMIHKMASEYRRQLAKQSCLLARRVGRNQIDPQVVALAEQAVIREMSLTPEADNHRPAA